MQGELYSKVLTVVIQSNILKFLSPLFLSISLYLYFAVICMKTGTYFPENKLEL
jgi:hypothetical protein